MGERVKMSESMNSEQMGADVEAQIEYEIHQEGVDQSLGERLEFLDGLLERWSAGNINALIPFTKGLWPVDGTTIASAGLLAPAIKAYLDEVEVIVGLIADSFGEDGEHELRARRLFGGISYLALFNVLLVIAEHIDYSAVGRPRENPFGFDERIQQEQLRKTWLDDRPIELDEAIGWSSWNSWYDEYFARGGDQMLNGFIAVVIQVADSLPEDQRFWIYNALQRADRALVQELCRITRCQVQPVATAMGLPHEIWSWEAAVDHARSGEQLPTPIDVIRYNMEQLEILISSFIPTAQSWSNWKFPGSPTPTGNKDFNASIQAKILILVAFAEAFSAPYNSKDLEIWRFVYDEVYQPLLSNHAVRKVITENFYHYGEEFKINWETGCLDEEIFEDLRRAFSFQSASFLHKSEFPSVEVAVSILEVVISIQVTAATRNHFPRRQTQRRLVNLWRMWYQLVEVLRQDDADREAKEVARQQRLNDGTFLSDVNRLVGLSEIKSQLNKLADLVRSGQLSETLSPARHVIFSGNPGTGKTTVARLVGEVYAALGILERGHVVEVTRADLVAQYTGQTAPKVAEAVRKAMGGVLFIDEAYSLRRSGLSNEGDSFGQEAIDELLVHMENKRGNFVVIAAGYQAEMDRFLSSNPGLRSRFSEIWHFDDYSTEELTQIFNTFATSVGVALTEEARDEFRSMALKAKMTKEFSNARWVRNVLDDAIRRWASRTSSNPSEARELTQKDLKDPEATLDLTSQKIAELRGRLSSLIGLKSVKSDFEALIAQQLLRKRRFEAGLPELSSSAGHLVFAGDPGTGKTTVARLIGDLYRELGLLKSGHVVEVQRADLVAGYVGQTAIKTAEVIKRAEGGVLFIDEAYALVSSESGSNAGSLEFGREAIETLLKMMEDRKGTFVVIAAGYPNEMQRFLDSNPGLRSRFERTLFFERWDAQDLESHLRQKLSELQLVLLEDDDSLLTSICVRSLELREFSSGRTARQILNEVVSAQASRLLRQPDAPLTDVTAEDLEQVLSWIASR